jgi:PTS system galactitol-specific IIA component
MNDYFREEFIRVEMESENSTDVISTLGGLLFNEGYVKDTFITATLEREKEYAPGIQVGSTGIAIPHTDCVHVNKMAIAVGVLCRPVKFGIMGGDGEINVDLVFLLALVACESQISLLQCFSEFFEKDAEIEIIRRAKNPKEVLQVLNNEIHFIS